MLGDAAYCASPLTGSGTTLAMAGAYLLAGELATQPDYEQAFARYEAWLRPFVEAVQHLPPGIPRLLYPASRLGVRALNLLFWLVGSRLGRRLVRYLRRRQVHRGNPRRTLGLPDYTP